MDDCNHCTVHRRRDIGGNANVARRLMRGDFPDPTILRDGVDFYVTCSSFDYYPGLIIWHSRDLVRWKPIGPALHTYVGSVWAPDLVKHHGRYFIYFPARGDAHTNYVVWADDIRGPWSAPIDLHVGGIDPGHAVSCSGRRYLFLSDGWRVPLSDDGLSVSGEGTKVYDGWRYPDHWEVETFALEGPKLFRREGYFYLLSAQGGTAGPPTGHMVIAARARSLDGPWENSPHNPVVRTTSIADRWWSRGHGTVVDTNDDQWWIVYHAYENGFRTLGRQALIEPVEWTPDGWFRAAGHARPLTTPPRRIDSTSAWLDARLWQLYDSADTSRIRREGDTMILRAEGARPADCSPLAFPTGDHAYELDVEIDVDGPTSAGVLVFYSRRLYGGLGFNADDFVLHNAGDDLTHPKPTDLGRRLFLRLRNDHHIVTMYFSADGERWNKYDRVLEVSGYHHNVAYDFLSLRPAIYAAGSGEARFRQLRYRSLG